MGILSSSASITRYKVDGKFDNEIMTNILSGLKKNTIQEIDNDPEEMALGWTNFQNPFHPDFENTIITFGTHIVFSLRMDKKNIPSKLIQKCCQMEMAKKLKETGKEFLNKNEKESIKEHVINMLNLRIPAIPQIYDLIWNYEEGMVWFFSNLKSANEALETLFSKSFKLRLIRLFPYTMGYFESELNDKEKDQLEKLSPTQFNE